MKHLLHLTVINYNFRVINFNFPSIFKYANVTPIYIYIYIYIHIEK